MYGTLPTTKTELLKVNGMGKSRVENYRHAIFGQLASFIPSGKVKIIDLMSTAHYDELKTAIPQISFENLSDLKHQLDDKYSYGEL
ncbi:helix-turn-helix domain-containing protein [Tamlana flava]|uniref:helix-turn-helix domain-containing protein n=1 Tax=Tamlana flava TaxID=3158572 RepID=UPI00351B429A